MCVGNSAAILSTLMKVCRAPAEHPEMTTWVAVCVWVCGCGCVCMRMRENRVEKVCVWGYAHVFVYMCACVFLNLGTFIHPPLRHHVIDQRFMYVCPSKVKRVSFIILWLQHITREETAVAVFDIDSVPVVERGVAACECVCVCVCKYVCV